MSFKWVWVLDFSINDGHEEGDEESQDSNEDYNDVQDENHAKEYQDAVFALSDAIEREDRVVGVFRELDH
jgi:hypothetical protein